MHNFLHVGVFEFILSQLTFDFSLYFSVKSMFNILENIINNISRKYKFIWMMNKYEGCNFSKIS